MLLLSEIIIYPIKSLGGISIPSAIVTDRGLQHDRRWMLTDENGIFLTQRTFPEMCLLKVELQRDSLKVHHTQNPSETIRIPFNFEVEKTIKVKVWNDTCDAQIVSEDIDAWFSERLKRKCHLVYMPNDSKRILHKENIANGKAMSFADGYPILIIGEGSLNHLNEKLETPLPMNRFRPNLVVSGGKPHEEDTWDRFMIGKIVFASVKPCERCNLTTINQDDATIGKEPLKTLATYRKKPDSNHLIFGMNLIAEHEGKIRAGYAINVLDLFG